MKIKRIYDKVIEKINSDHIKCINNMDKPLFLISTAYPGVWLEHVYDSVMYAKLFNDTSIAVNTINTFIDLQLENGEYPYSIKQNNTVGYYQIQECVSFARLAFMTYEMVNDNDFLLKIYNSAKKWVDWLYKYRMTLNKGLVEMFVGYDTGHDNSARLDGMKYHQNYKIDDKIQNASILPDCPCAPIIAVDMNCNLYKTLKTIAKMANILNDKLEEEKYNQMADTLKKNLFDVCYSDEDVFFYDVDKYGNKRKYLSSTILHLFLEGVLDKNEDKDLIDKIYNLHIKNENEFYTPYPFPAMAVNDPSWISHKMPNSWGYYSQALIALRCSLWMDDYGYSNDYDHILSKWVEGLVDNFDEYPMSQELDPITGKSPGSSLWYSTSMLLFIYAVRRLKLV